MLILHSSSRCDVCLSEFSWEDTGKRPHAIACGHIFCRDCLYANSPPLCPLCRRIYQPGKIKRLHVDRPEATDENKELDLLQRLALAWESPQDQLKDVVEEVDAWLRDRSEDSCLPLRKARAALGKNSELREYGVILRDYIVKLDQRRQDLELGLQREQHKGLVQAEASRTMIDGLNKEVYRLTLELEGMSSYSHRHKSRNPLPRPPEPISTDRVPTLEQAMEQAILESGLGARSIDLPTSPHRQPFEVENYSHTKGKGKSRAKDLWMEGQSRYHATSPSHPDASIPPLPSSSSYYVHPHSSSHQPRYDEPTYSTTATSTRATDYPTYAENTNQDFDIFNAMSFYMREYTSGFLNGQEVARGERMTEEDNRRNDAPRTSASQNPQSSSRRHKEHRRTEHRDTEHRPSEQRHPERHPEQRPPNAHHEPNGTHRHSTAPNAQQNSPPQPRSPPVAGERSSRSSRRPETVSSIISSPVLSSRNGRPSPPTSQTRSGGGLPSVPTYQAQTPTPVNPSGSSGHSVAPSENSVRSPSPRASGSVLPPSPPALPSQPQRIVPSPQPNTNTNPPVQAPAPYRPPSLISFQSQPSIDTWGTAPPSHLASGSLVSGLLAFREGAETAMVDAQESFVFRELNSHGSSIRSRNSIVVDSALLEVPHPEYSPSRPVQTMVGVLPDEEEPVSLSVYSPRAESDRPPSYRSSQSNGDRHSPNHDEHQHQYQPVSPNRSRRSAGSSRSVVDDERSYRSSSRSHEDRRHSPRHGDQHSVASSQSSLRVPPAAGRIQPLSLPEESPLVEYADDDQESMASWQHRSLSRSDSIEHSTESYNNALGLDFEQTARTDDIAGPSCM